MATNDVWQLSVQGTVSETMHIHTLHFLEVAGPLLGSDLITAYSAAPLTAYRAWFSTFANPVQKITAQKVCGTVPLPAPDENFPTVANSAGTRSTGVVQPSPAFLATLVNERGTLAGRRYSGRFFLGGMYEDDQESNLLSAACVTRAQAYCSALAAAFIPPGGGLAWRLFAFSELLADGDPLHTRRNPAGGARIADPVTAVPCQQAGSPVASLVVNPRPTTMRSRKYGHGL
jgi:hypothetical protein